ncbi:alcohol dehydrogenase catalytic domain-containing protein [Glaciihabitans sp. UYNi722]|uniref:alcohol dehydrogenase catalytic domain-containing protein n=1 Tax=Glaciihabitans sp. UYNi722 TaxID=3156344 RepID=UPI003394B78C
MVSAGICGTDLAFAAGGVQGFVYGHEFAGVGADGREYFVEPTIFGGQCAECRSGNIQRCTEEGHGNLGIFRDGGMAESISVPESALLALPDGPHAKDACLAEPGAVAWHAVRHANWHEGERLAIIGGGSIGLLAAAVVVAASGETALEEAAKLAKPGARIVSLGVYATTIPNPGPVSLIKELTYVNSIAYGLRNGIRETSGVAAMLADRPELADTIITHRFPLNEAREAFRVASDRSTQSIKVVLEAQEGN